MVHTSRGLAEHQQPGPRLSTSLQGSNLALQELGKGFTSELHPGPVMSEPRT